MKRVSIFPPWEPWLGNRLFTDAEGCVYTSSFKLWRQEAVRQGYQLDTCDICPPSEADLLWFMDLPRSKHAFEEVRRSVRKGTTLVLQILESPLLFPATFVEVNRRLFDAVVSYEFSADEGRHFHYRLPLETEPRYEGLPFGARKLAVMVNTNRVEGWLATRKRGLTGLPGMGAYFSGWKLPVWHFLRPAQGELYSWRRRCACAALAVPGRLEVMGSGWNGERISWCPGLYSRRYTNHRPADPVRRGTAANAEKRACLGNYRFVIATENYQGNFRYISEKIFDAMLGGSVPVYLGEESIGAIVPAEAFVDAGRFRTANDLWRYLEMLPEEQWQSMRQAGQEYLFSKAFQPYTSGAFARRMMKVLDKLTIFPDFQQSNTPSPLGLAP